MKSKLFRLDASDFLKGLITAVISSVTFSLLSAMGPDFDVFTADWHAIGKMAVNIAVYTLVGYLGKNFISDDQGKVLGIDATGSKPPTDD